MSFLKAEWRKLLLANYHIEPSILLPYLPFGTELDLWQGKCYVSLVGFMFQNTKILGIKIPFHVNFEEVNLRFYVKRFENGEWKRGVVFIKEIVPKFAITFVANTLYKENYETLPMKHFWEEKGSKRVVQYAWQKSAKWYSIHALAEKKASPIEQGSEAEFITEHYWGYAAINAKSCNEYQVTHPRWNAYKVLDYQIEVDFGIVYGEKFSFLNQLTPNSVFLAEGSSITVEKGKAIFS